jgi:hypothetical protein
LATEKNNNLQMVTYFRLSEKSNVATYTNIEVRKIVQV